MSTPQALRILIVDDEASLMKALCDTLHAQGYETVGFTSGDAGLAALRDSKFDLLLADLMMPQMGGIALLRAAIEIDPDLVGIIMTGQGTIDTAVEAMKTGALDYILKPFKLSVILPVLSRALAVRQLRIENASLERRLRQRTAELEAANKELETFSYSVSHDLRAPLRAVKGFSDALCDDHFGELSAGAQQLVGRIQTSASRMETLVESLLDLARVSRQTLDVEAVDLSALARRALTQMAELEPQRLVELTLKDGILTFGDPGLLEVIVQNLLDNAWKYTGKTDVAEIEFGVRRDGVEPVYFVRDNGAGFDMKDAARLFAPFRRLHSECEFPGIGIGLATVARAVRRHGGRIWADATPAGGATFYFTLGESPSP